MEHFSRHPATFWEELSGLYIWPSGLLSSGKEGVVKSPKQHRAWANSVPAYFCLTHEIPTKPLTPWCVCVCWGGGGGTPFNLGWGCAAEYVGTWPSSIIKGHKPDKIVKIDALFQLAAGHEREQQHCSLQRDSDAKKVTQTPAVFQSQNGQKVQPVPDRITDF